MLLVLLHDAGEDHEMQKEVSHFSFIFEREGSFYCTQWLEL